MVHNINIVLMFLIGYFIRCVVSDHNNTHKKFGLPKCCAENEAILLNTTTYTLSCVTFTNAPVFSISNLTIYDKDTPDKPASKSFSDVFRVALDMRPSAEDFKSFYVLDGYQNFYLNENGLLYMEAPNSYIRWASVNNSLYCLDYQINESENSSEPQTLSENILTYCAYYEPITETSRFFPAASVISVVFLTLVLIVYMLLPRLRTLGGLILMAYIFSLIFSFLFLAIMQLSEHELENCLGLTTTVYYFYLASFCWMTVMSYDIWWTFRGYAKARPIHRRGEKIKFCIYCIYAWGLPLAMSITFVIINNTPMTHIPWFIKPQIPEKGCFLSGGEKFLYLYVPMLILILHNWIFFLMTVFNIWRLQRGTAMLNSSHAGTLQNHRKQKNRFLIYVKISVIVGLNWIFEVLSYLTPAHPFWYITDAYNFLIGPILFVMFVCNKKIYRDLKSRFNKIQIPQHSVTKSQLSCGTSVTTNEPSASTDAQ